MCGDIIFFGHRPYGIMVMKYLLDKGYRIPCVFVPPVATQETINEVKELLPEAEVFEGGGLSGTEMARIIKKYEYRGMLSTFYQGILSEEVINLGVVNIHGAILPEWRGAGTLNWAIIKGSTKGGITIHYMDETIDSGDIIDIIEYPINYEDDVKIIQQRMFEKTIELLDRCWEPLLNGQIEPKKQDHSLARYYRARTTEDNHVRWSDNAFEIRNLIRGLVEPFPGAFCYLEGEKVIIDKADVEIDNKVHFKAGKVLSVGDGAICRVTTGFNILIIEKIRNGEVLKKVAPKEGDCFE
ncbi:methionyl-tRNA formyltransferase [Chloroflexota bacterium]